MALLHLFQTQRLALSPRWCSSKEVGNATARRRRFTIVRRGTIQTTEVVVGSDDRGPQEVLAVHSWELLLELLQVFFRSDAAFIQRQGYQLGVFTTSLNILKAIRSKPKTLQLEKPQSARL